jgi:AraC-like DNA-binding protein
MADLLDEPVLAAGARHLIDLLEEECVDVSRLLDAAGLARTNLAADELPARRYVALVRAATGASRVPALGLRVGLRITLADFGMLGYAFLSSANLHEALNTYYRFRCLTGAPLVQIIRDEQDAETVFSFECRGFEAPIRRYLIDEMVGSIRAVWAPLVDGERLVSEVRLSIPEPADARLYAEFLGCDVQFSQEADDLRVPSRLLQVPFSLANESMAADCIRQCERLVARLEHSGQLVDRVRRELVQEPGRFPNEVAVAHRLSMSERALVRRLGEEGTCFRDIKREVRLSMAAEYLRTTDLSTKEIAALLDYSEVSNFHRAFKRHFGSTPGRYREGGAVERAAG